jgi:hypothetical protein
MTKIGICGPAPDIAPHFKFHRNRFAGFRSRGVRNLAFPYTFAHGFYKAVLPYKPDMEVAQVAFIPKPGRTDYSVANAFRTISLSFFLLKGLEKLVDWYLSYGPLVDLLINPRQHAFQAGRFTESALHQLVGRIERALEG